MLQEVYGQSLIDALPKLVNGRRYGVSVRISASYGGSTHQVVYEENDSISYELQIEPEKQRINFGKNIINAGFLGKQRS
jgi:hypothetical protein